MADKPSVLFISTCDITPEEIIKLVFRDQILPEKIKISEDIDAYPYHIDNKYYTTDIYLCCLKRKIIADKKFVSCVQGTVIFFDSTKTDCLKELDSWLPYLDVYQPEIKILLCKNSPEETKEGCSKRMAQEWCIGKWFELVELEPDVDEEDSDDDFPETTGVSRIIQVLNAHIWPNLVMKNSKNATTSGENNGVDLELSTLTNQLLLEESLEELLENDDDFSKLFSQLPELKARVSALQGADRMNAAVQIVEAFWKAMGDTSDTSDILDL